MDGDEHNEALENICKEAVLAAWTLDAPDALVTPAWLHIWKRQASDYEPSVQIMERRIGRVIVAELNTNRALLFGWKILLLFSWAKMMKEVGSLFAAYLPPISTILQTMIWFLASEATPWDSEFQPRLQRYTGWYHCYAEHGKRSLLQLALFSTIWKIRFIKKTIYAHLPTD